MRITEFEITNRKQLFLIEDTDERRLAAFRPHIDHRVDLLVNSFYEMQTGITEIALLIGDADTLARLRNAQRRYVLDLFSGVYDLEYVNNRLRIGLVHKRIGVEPKLYLSAVLGLKRLLQTLFDELLDDHDEREALRSALDKLIMFDITLVFETYIRSLVAEIEASREKSERYASALEETVLQRTQQLEEMTRTDALTGLQSVRFLHETLTRLLRACQRRTEPLTVVYLDIDDFKLINDTQGHHRGDEVLRGLGECLRRISRAEDACFRYGGDEFCILLPNCREDQAREVFATRLTLELSAKVGAVGVSFGVVQTGPTDYGAPDALIQEADVRMLASKRARKGTPTAAAPPPTDGPV